MSSIVLPVILDENELRTSLQRVAEALSNVSKKLKSDVDNFSKSFEEQGENLSRQTKTNLQASTQSADSLSRSLLLSGAEALKINENFGNIAQTIDQTTAGQERQNSTVVSTTRNVLLLRQAYKFYLSDMGQTHVLAASNHKEVGSMLETIKRTATAVRGNASAYALVGVGIGTTAVAAWSLYRVTEATFNLINRESRSQSLGLMRSDVQSLVEAYGGLLSRAQATEIAMQFRQAGIPKTMLADAFQLTNTLERLTGQTTDAITASIAQGNVSEDVLKRIGLTQEMLENAYQKAQGASQRALTQQEKTVIALQMMSSATKGLRQDVINAFPESPFKKASVALQNLWQSAKELAATFVKILLPVIEATAFVMEKVVRGFDFITRAFVGAGNSVAGFSDKTKKASTSAQSLSQVLEKTQNSTRKVGERLHHNNEEIGRFRGLVQAAREASRSALNSALGSVVGLTGASGELLKNSLSLNAEMEKFGVLYGRSVGAAINLTMRSLDLQLTELGIYGRKRNALMQLSAQGEVYRSTLAEIFGNARLMIGAEKALLGISGEQANLVQARVALRKEEIAQAKQSASFTTQIATLEAKQEELLLRRRQSRSTVERQSLLEQYKFLLQQQRGIEGLQKIQEEYNKAKTQTLQIAEATALIERNTAVQREQLRLAQAQLQERFRLNDLQKQLNRFADEGTLLSMDRTKRLAELEQERQNIALETARIQDRIASGVVRGDDLERAKNELTILQEKQRVLTQEGVLTERLFNQQINQTTLLGSAFDKLAMQGVNASKKIGESLTQNLGAMLSSIGSALQGLFSGLIQGEKDAGKNFGKSLLSALGDMAIAFATTFAGIGAGKIAMGDFAGGAGLLAASVALFAAAGLVKGFASGSSSSSSASPSSTPPRQQLPNVQPQREQERNTFILVSNRIFGSEEDQARALKNFVQKNQRVTGKFL